MSHDVCHRLQSPLVLIGSCNLVALWMRAVLPIGQEYRHLRAQLRELERACAMRSTCDTGHGEEDMDDLHAIKVIQDPAVAPAAPKQAIDARLG